MNGHLEVLQWVRETGAVWNETRVRRHVAVPKQQLVLTWRDELSAPWRGCCAVPAPVAPGDARAMPARVAP